MCSSDLMQRFLLILGCLGVFFPLLSSPVAAQKKWDGGCVGPTGLGEDVATIQGVACLMRNILNVVLTILGFIGFIMLVYASFNLLISGGQPSHLEKTKGTFTYVIIGLFLAIGSYAIMLVVDNLINGTTGSGQSIMKLEFIK